MMSYIFQPNLQAYAPGQSTKIFQFPCCEQTVAERLALRSFSVGTLTSSTGDLEAGMSCFDRPQVVFCDFPSLE